MITLSIRQPWPWLILNHEKDIENRNWKTSHRGPFLIHAGKNFDDPKHGRQCIMDCFGIELPPDEEMQRGGIVGMAEITDCTDQSDSQWFYGPYGFVLKNAKALPFLPCPGKLQFFEVDYRLPT